MALLLVAVLLQAAAEDPAQAGPIPPAAAAASPSPLNDVHGSLGIRFRHRTTSDQSDTDLYEVLVLQAGDPARHPATLHAVLRVAEDLDGERGNAGAHVYDSIDDTYDSGVNAFLHTLYVDVPALAEGLSLRVGRQVLEEFPEAVAVDAVLARVQGGPVAFSAFGGLPVNLYESSTDGDLAYGAAIELRAWKGGLLRADWIHLDDETVIDAFSDDLIGFGVEQRAGVFLLRARHTMLEGDSRESTGWVSGAFPDVGLVLHFRGSWLWERQVAYSYALEPYTTFLMDLQPYYQLTLGASQVLTGPLSVDLAATLRELARDSDEGTHNREFLRVNATPRLTGWPDRSLSAAVFLDAWNTSEDDFWTAGGEIAWKATATVTLSVSTTYALYDLDEFTGEERERVRLFSTQARWNLGGGLELLARMEWEMADLDDFRTATIGARHAF